jgi:hypothetical protein
VVQFGADSTSAHHVTGVVMDYLGIGAQEAEENGQRADAYPAAADVAPDVASGEETAE